MTWTAHTTEKARHLVLRASAGESLPGALVAMLRDEAVACGWLRGSGLLADVELRAFDGHLGALGASRRLAGPVHVLSLESGIGLAGGDPSFTLRAVLARETDHGLETFAGEIVAGTTVALELLVTALDDLALEHAPDAASGLWMLTSPGTAGTVVTPAAPVRAAAPAASWSSALHASDRAEREPARPRPAPVAPPAAPSQQQEAMVMPARPARPAIDFDVVYPEPGDAVEHFAFGPADVVKSDGDRLHLKVHKDSRVREIALEMLKVSRMADLEDGRRRFRLERRL